MMHDVEIEFDLVKILGAMKKKLVLFVLMAAICGCAMAAYQKQAYVPEYETFALLYIDTTDEKDIGKDIVSNCKDLLFSRKNCENVIQTLNLDESYEYLYENIYAYQGYGPNMFELYFYHNNPDEAMLIANTLVEELQKNMAALDKDVVITVIDSASTADEYSSPSYGKDGVAAGLGVFVCCTFAAIVLEVFRLNKMGQKKQENTGK